jgi:aspartate aminotransferase
MYISGGSVGYNFSARADSVEESGIRKMLGLAKPGAINLSIGEPNIEPPANVRAALKRAVDENRSTYGPSGGVPELREAIAAKLRPRWKDVKKENVVVTVGASEALFATAHIFYERGDEVLCPDPGFFLYAAHAKIHGARPVAYHLPEESGRRPVEEDLKAKINPRTKAIVINSPSNPTGMAFRREDIRMVSDLARDHDLVVISDEVYDELVFDRRHESFLCEAEKLIYINSFSKTYSTTGWRMGYVAAVEEVAKKLEKTSYHLLACPPTMTQYAAIEALKPETDGFVKKMVAEFRDRRDIMVRGLNAIDGFRCPNPDGTIYVFPSYKFRLSSAELAMKLIEKGVVTVPGFNFGELGEGHLRICLGARRADLEEALRRIADAAKDLG